MHGFQLLLNPACAALSPFEAYMHGFKPPFETLMHSFKLPFETPIRGLKQTFEGPSHLPLRASARARDSRPTFKRHFWILASFYCDVLMPCIVFERTISVLRHFE